LVTEASAAEQRTAQPRIEKMQQNATPEVRFCALLRRVAHFGQRAIIACIHAGLVRVYVTIAQWRLWICKPSVIGSNPIAGSS